MTGETKPTRSIATCRSCRRAFTKDGYGAQSIADARRCRDCVFADRLYEAIVRDRKPVLDPRD